MRFREDPENAVAHRRAVRTRRRDRHCGARAWRDAARPRLDAAAEEPSRGARPRGVEDQPRSAQPARLRAAVLRPARRACPTRNVQRFAPQADALARARHRVLPVDAVLRPGEGAAARPQAGAAGAAGRGSARDARPRSRVAGALDRVGRARPARSTPIPTSCSASSLNLARNALQALESRAPERARPRSAPHHRAGARARWR